MAVVRLSQQLLDTYRCPEGQRRIELADEELPGLLFEFRSTGRTATAWLRYKGVDDRRTKYAKLGTTAELSLVEARVRARRLKAEILANHRDPRAEQKAARQVPTLRELFLEKYLPIAKQRLRSWKRSEELYRLRIDARFGNKRLNEITKQQIETFHAELKRDGLAEASADHHLKVIKRALNCAIQWGLFPGPNPAVGIKAYNPDNRIGRALNDVELERFVRVLNADANRPVADLLLVALGTGTRLHELTAARWEQFDLERRTWTIPAKTAKSKKGRTIPLNATVMQVLERQPSRQQGGFVFISAKTKQPIRHIAKVFERIRREADLPGFRIHDVRHSHAGIILSAGGSIAAVSKLLGHHDVSFTLRTYGHLSQRALEVPRP